MKTRKFIFNPLLKIIAIAVAATFGQTSQATAQDIKFLQDIQNQLLRVSGIRNRNIKLLVTEDQKRKITLTPTSVSLSYGYLKQMNNINQLIAAMAHMTAHISLDYVVKPPLPENHGASTEKTSVTDYLKDAFLRKYPDEGYMPQATGAFHTEGATIIERPSYQNKNYKYSLNKKDILIAEHELEVDKITDKIIRHSGFCPSDYSRMLHYFYENPQLLLGDRHFVLDNDGWQRIDAINSRADPAAVCDDTQIAQTQKYANSFDQLRVRVMLALKNKKKFN